MSYLVLKTIHLIAVVCWFAGLFYLGRLFIYHKEAEKKLENSQKILQEQYKLMANRLMNISGFSGSAGLSVLTKSKKYLFVDGRYTTQAKIETKGYFKIFELPKTFPEDIFKKEKIKLKIGYDPSLFTSNMIKRYFGNSCNLVAVKKNLIDEITLKKNSIKQIGFYSLSSKITGETVNSKIKRLTSVLKEKKIDNLFISAPENVAWLLNIRGQDNPNSPIPNCRAVITKSKKVIINSNYNI